MSVRVGILGFAHGHVAAYLNQWRDRPELGVQAVAGWDHDAERMRKSCGDYNLKAYPDVEGLLAADVDAVVVSSETLFHADLVEQAAAAGKAIIVQKPMALTLAQADRIVAAVAKHKSRFTMAWQMRTDPQNTKMKELIASGELGKPLLVRRRHCLSTNLWAGFESTWHNNAAYNRDIFADDASHPIDFIHWLLGVPETVTAEMGTLLSATVPNDNGIAIFRYPGGPIAEVVCSFVASAGENTTEIVAEKGVVVQNYGDGPSTSLPRPEGVSGLKWHIAGAKDWTFSDIPTPPSHGHRIAGLAEPLAEFLHGRRGPVATAEEGRTSLKMLLACYVSSREGQRVHLCDPRIADV